MLTKSQPERDRMVVVRQVAEREMKVNQGARRLRYRCRPLHSAELARSESRGPGEGSASRNGRTIAKLRPHRDVSHTGQRDETGSGKVLQPAFGQVGIRVVLPLPVRSRETEGWQVDS